MGATALISDRMVCIAVRERDRRGHHELLARMSDQPVKVCGRALERAYRHGLIDFGTTMDFAWLTPTGEAFLADRAAPLMATLQDIQAAYRRAYPLPERPPLPAWVVSPGAGIRRR